LKGPDKKTKPVYLKHADIDLSLSGTQEQMAGIPNWCPGRLKRFFKNGGRLVQPRKVSVATGNLRTVSDTVGLFLLSECVFEPGGWLSRSAFREMFEKWCSEEGIHRGPTGRRISIALRERGVSEGLRIGNDRTLAGIRWKNQDERASSERSGTYQVVLT